MYMYVYAIVYDGAWLLLSILSVSHSLSTLLSLFLSPRLCGVFYLPPPSFPPALFMSLFDVFFPTLLL